MNWLRLELIRKLPFRSSCRKFRRIQLSRCYLRRIFRSCCRGRGTRDTTPGATPASDTSGDRNGEVHDCSTRTRWTSSMPTSRAARPDRFACHFLHKRERILSSCCRYPTREDACDALASSAILCIPADGRRRAVHLQSQFYCRYRGCAAIPISPSLALWVYECAVSGCITYA